MPTKWTWKVGIAVIAVTSLVQAEPFQPGGRSPVAAATESPQVVVAPPGFSLNLDGDIDVGGAVFKDGTPFIHEDGGATSRNTGMGRNALVSTTPGVPTNTNGVFNSALGFQALRNNTEGSLNTGLGESALFGNTSGLANTAVGSAALYSNSLGDGNTSTGYASLISNTYGAYNTATGMFALGANTHGHFNTAAGQLALSSNTTGDRNVAVGAESLRYSGVGHKNTAVGYGAAAWMYEGDRNTALGTRAGFYWTNGDDNIAVGSGSNGFSSDSGTIRIGGYDLQTATYVEGISSTGVSGVQVMITGDDQLGIAVSSARFKKEVSDLGDTSERLQKLRPVAFRYAGEQLDPEGRGPVVYGLLAEEVAEVFPELVVNDDDGLPFTIRHHLLTPLLIGEIQRQESELDKLEGQIEALRELVLNLKEQTKKEGEGRPSED